MNAVPSSTASIFSIISSDVSILLNRSKVILFLKGITQKFALIIDNYCELAYIIAGSSPQYNIESGTVSLATWTNVYVGFEMLADMQTVYCAIYYNDFFGRLGYTLPSANSLIFTANDLTRIGGISDTFVGEIAGLRIMSPGTLVIKRILSLKATESNI